MPPLACASWWSCLSLWAQPLLSPIPGSLFLFSFLPFGLLWPPVTLEVLASPGWCTVAKNTLSSVAFCLILFSTSCKQQVFIEFCSISSQALLVSSSLRVKNSSWGFTHFTPVLYLRSLNNKIIIITTTNVGVFFLYVCVYVHVPLFSLEFETGPCAC